MAEKLPGNDLDPILRRLALAPGLCTGQVVVVTGSGRGIGMETARLFGRLGAQVVIAELSEQGREVEAQIRAEGGQALYIPTDVASMTSVTALAQQVHAAFGPVNILINNAILCPVASVLEMSPELFDQVLGVNLRGAFLTCKTFLPDMIAAQQGVVINMISTDAVPYLSAYIASKQGLAAFSRSLAAEMGESGVNVIALAPGFVDTPGLRSAAQGLGPHMGLTPDEFLNLPFHATPAGSAAYPGAMPPLDAAAATAYLALRLAQDYHGDVTNGYVVLERAGFLQPQDEPGQADGTPQHTASSSPIPDVIPPLKQAIQAAGKLRTILDESEAEMNRFPVFVRPLMRSGFKSKTGLGLPEWKSAAADLVNHLASIQASGGCYTGKLPEHLEKISAYYAGAQAAASHFTRDAQTLTEIRATAEARMEVIAELTRLLRQLAAC